MCSLRQADSAEEISEACIGSNQHRLCVIVEVGHAYVFRIALPLRRWRRELSQRRHLAVADQTLRSCSELPGWNAGDKCLSLIKEIPPEELPARTDKVRGRSAQSIRRDLLFPTVLAGGFLVAASLVE
jgi:hypothetical protein